MSWLKYVLVPGHVRSRHDGDLHWIGVPTLAQLYGVKLRECVVYPDHDRAALQRQFDARHADLVWLYPQVSGDYTLPTAPGPRAGV